MEKVEIVVATTNQGKLKEIQERLKDFPVQLLDLKQIGFTEEIVEDKETFEGNAILKATTVAQKSGKIALADDSGLEVDALNGAPGVYSARYAGEGATDHQNNLKLLKEMTEVPASKRQAHFRCAIALATPEKLIGTVDGVCSGTIGYEEKGEHGFGYDSLFVIPEYEKTFGELGASVKRKMSHRAQALEKIIFLFKNIFN